MKKTLLLLFFCGICYLGHSQDVRGYFFNGLYYDEHNNPSTAAILQRFYTQGKVVEADYYEMIDDLKTLKTTWRVLRGYYGNYIPEWETVAETREQLQYTKDAVFSISQFYRNELIPQGRRNNDKITLLALPLADGPRIWNQRVNGEREVCRSEWAYITDDDEFFEEVIKITTEAVGYERSRKCSYWAYNLGKVWETSANSSRTLTRRTYFDQLREVTKAEYDAYIKKKEDEARRKEEEALLKKKMEAFKEKTKPQPLEQKYANYQQPIIGIIDAQVNTLDVIGKGPMVITIASSNDVRVEDGAFSASPQIGKSVKEYLLKLLNEGKIQLDTAINPSANQSVEIPLIYKVSQIPSIVTKNYYLDYKKGMWYDAQTKEPFYRSSSLENMIYSAADEFRSNNKKAKWVTVVVKYIDFNNNLHLKGIENVYIRQ